MSAFFPEGPRHIFPRWRSFKITNRLGELAHPTTSRERDDKGLDESLALGIAEWNSEPTLWRGLDLVGTAVVTGQLPKFSRLADEIRRDPHTPEAARRFLTRLLEAKDPSETTSDEIPTGEHAGQTEIRFYRDLIRTSQSNPVAWVELARSHTIAGNNQKAKAAILTALQLAPNNRFVLRSAARFFIHIGEPDRANALLARSQAIRTDPWILASQIAIADSISKTSRFFKVAQQKLESDIPRSETTELAAALGSLEAENGNHRIARRLLRRSTESANENSVAQISWLNRSILNNAVDVSKAHPPLLHEANANSSFYRGEFEEAKREALLWMEDQPFASAPAVMSSYIYADILNDFAGGKKIAEMGLISNQDDTQLLNNLAVCLLELGEMESAQAAINKLKAALRGGKPDPVYEATYGMLEFRKGNIEAGRKHYADAIDTAESNGQRSVARRAALHLALEEIVAGTEMADGKAEKILDAESASDLAEVKKLKARMLNLLNASRGKNGQGARE